MTTFFLVRHATNDWLKKGRLPGWMNGIHLNDDGHKQARAAAERLSPVKLDAVYSSHLERARETAQYIAARRKMHVVIRRSLADLKTGEWTGRSIRQAARTKLWKRIQSQPTHERMPGGESFSEMQGRLIGELDRICQAHPKGAVAVVSHADAIRSIVAYYLRLPLDHFQRLIIAPASITVILVQDGMARLVRLNDTGPFEPWPPSRRTGRNWKASHARRVRKRN